MRQSNYLASTSLVFLPFVILIAQPVRIDGALILDQSFEAEPFLSFGFGGDVELAQTFTVGISGILAQVDVQIGREQGIPDILFDLRPTIGGIPIEDDSAALVTVTVPSASVPTEISFFSVDVGSFQIPVSVGDVLAVILRAPG